MSFFELPPPPPEAEQPRFDPPEWFGPPDNVLPGPFALEQVLARTDQVALLVHSGRAYTNGFEFAFGLVTREQHDRRPHDPMMAWHGIRRGDGLGDEVLRFGIELADGRKATVFDRHPPFEQDAAPPAAVLQQRGGGGGGKSWEFRFWAWPLPPEGPLAFVVEWPSEGIALTRTEVDTKPIREAAGHAEELWPDRGIRGGRGWVGAFRT